MALNRKGWPRAGKVWGKRERDGRWWQKVGRSDDWKITLFEGATSGKRDAEIDIANLRHADLPVLRQIAAFLEAEEIRD